MGEARKIKQLEAKAIERFQTEQSMLFGECALNLMMTHMPEKAVIQWLEDQIAIIKEHG